MNLSRGHDRDRETLQTGQSCNLLQKKKKLQDLAVKIFTVSQIFFQLFAKVKVFLRLRQFLVLFTKPFILVIFCFEKVSARIFHSVP